MAYKTSEERRQAYLNKREHYLELGRQRYINKKEELLEYQRQYRAANRSRMNEKTKQKRLDRLLAGIQLLGGECKRCHNKFDPVCFDFHHLDPTQKEVTIGENMLIGKERFFNEIKKCILLCSNCHRLVHKELRQE